MHETVIFISEKERVLFPSISNEALPRCFALLGTQDKQSNRGKACGLCR